MNQRFAVFLSLLLLCLNLLSAQSAEQTVTQKIAPAFEKSKLPGIGLAMVNKNEILYQKGFGYADIVSQNPFTESTVQNIGSISKTLIGVALMKLVDEKKLRLDDPVNDYLPFDVVHPGFPNAVITIKHLATHTSGLKDTSSNYDLKAYYFDADLDTIELSKKGFSFEEKIFLKKTKHNRRIALGEYLQKVLKMEGEWYSPKSFYDFEPGSIYEYSNIGAALAAYIVEILSEKPYDQFTQEEIFEPLKMKSSGWFYKDVDMTQFATRYVGKKNAIVPFYELSTYPDGGLKSSVTDLSLFFQEMLKGYAGESEFLSKSSFEILFKNHLSVPDGERQGIFWDVFGEGGVGDIGHSGSDPGIYTFMYFNPTTGIGKILFTNSSGTESKTIAVWEEFIKMENLFLQNYGQ